MRPEIIDQAAKDLLTVYDDGVCCAQEGPQTLVRINALELYPTCRPPVTPMLLVFDPDHPKPLVYVQPGQRLANGREPKNSTTVLVGGETWMQFSFDIPWTEGDSIMRFVAAARQRFAQDE
jgi:hypothetical protein